MLGKMTMMGAIQDLIEEAKLRTVYWSLFIFAVSYFLTHTSKSMWMNLPIAVLLVSGIRILFNEVDFHWKVRNVLRPSYLAHLAKKQLSINDSRLSTLPPPPKWKRKINSPVVEAAIEDFVNKLLQDFVVDLWYSMITSDREAPELIHAIIMDALGEVSGRVKEINLVELLTRDVVDLIGDHIDLFRRSQSIIGVDVMGTLCSEERDERLKYHMLSTKELHPALMSPESEYKVLQRLMGGILAVVLRPRESQCPLVRCIAREILTCLVMQPVINLATPTYINQVIEIIFTALKDMGFEEAFAGQSSQNSSFPSHAESGQGSSSRNAGSSNQGTDLKLSEFNSERGGSSGVQDSLLSNEVANDPLLSRSGDWARVLEAATQRRTEVLMPENLENMWAIGRNYKKKLQKKAATGPKGHVMKVPASRALPTGDAVMDGTVWKPDSSDASNNVDDKNLMQLVSRPEPLTQFREQGIKTLHLSQQLGNEGLPVAGSAADGHSDASSAVVNDSTSKLKRSISASDLLIQPGMKDGYPKGGNIIAEFYGANASLSIDVSRPKSSSDMLLRSEASHASKLKCRIVGAYFEKLGSKSFAVYSISVTDADNHTWFVKRRYSNFERLHRHLKDIPNYTLHLPPKRIFSSSTEDTFVHQRCIQLDKYLQDLLSISNVAEQHDVWDFLSVSSKNYSCGKSSSVIRTLAVNVDDAMDDIVRQFKGVSDGFARKVVGSPSSTVPAASVPTRHLSWNVDDSSKAALASSISDSANSLSDNEEGYKAGSQVFEEVDASAQDTGWHSDNELNPKGFPPRVVKGNDELGNMDSQKKFDSGFPSKSPSLGKSLDSSSVVSDRVVDRNRVPPEWTPPNLSVPVLNLVDNIFQLNKRGWLRRQVFWISKQICQLMMEDAIDDWLLMQIHWIRRDDVVAEGIRWLQNVLWPDGTFFLKLTSLGEMDGFQPNEILSQSTESMRSKVNRPASFEQQLETARRASDVKKILYDGAPAALVSLIGHTQYKRCASDLYYFLQSTVCMKQLAYGILELVLVSVFPELQDLIIDIHEKAHA